MNITIDTSNIALSAIRLCTVSQILNDWYGSNNSASSSSVNFVTDWVDRTTADFESITNLSLVSRSLTGYYDGNGTNSIFVNNFPISSVTSIKYRNSPLDTYSNSIPAANIITYYDKIELYNYIFEVGSKKYEIIYNAGYASGSKELKTLEGLAIKVVSEVMKKSNAAGGFSENRLGIASSQGNELNSVYKEVMDEIKPMLLNFTKI